VLEIRAHEFRIHGSKDLAYCTEQLSIDRLGASSYSPPTE